MKIKWKSKPIILIIGILVIGFIGYYLFIPEYDKSKNVNEIYVYVKDGMSQKKYTIKYNEEFNIRIKNSEYSILLPYNHTISYDWQLSPITNNTKLCNSFIKEGRIPLYDKGKEGVDYSMKVFEFKNNNPLTEKLVFKYLHTKGQKSDEDKNIIINVQYE